MAESKTVQSENKHIFVFLLSALFFTFFLLFRHET